MSKVGVRLLRVTMSAWGIDSEFFQRGLKLDPTGSGAGYARIAVAARESRPDAAAECWRGSVLRGA
jgi:hypothetical protein